MILKDIVGPLATAAPVFQLAIQDTVMPPVAPAQHHALLSLSTRSSAVRA